MAARRGLHTESNGTAKAANLQSSVPDAKHPKANNASIAATKSKPVAASKTTKSSTIANNSKTSTTKSAAPSTTKRKRSSLEEDEVEEKAKSTAIKKKRSDRPVKKSAPKATKKAPTRRPRQPPQAAATEEPAIKTRPAAATRPGPVINKAPTQRLSCFVFGENGSGELGLGHMNAPGKRVIDVKRPRLNPKLPSDDVGVVQISCGGMHVAALTQDNKILTWGVNDQGALGRTTKGGEQYKAVNDQGEEEEDDEDDMNSGLNALEAAPAEADYINIPEKTIFTKVAAGDSTTMVLTSTGEVYGCGTFRSNEGILGFTKEVEVQHNLSLVPGLKNIVDLVCGTNHVIALDNKGRAYAFGSGQQNQLGRRIVERTKLNSLVPTPLSIPRAKIVSVSAGSYHSFAIDDKGRVWSWGLNSFGQTGIREDAGTDGGAIIAPTLVESLSNQDIKVISGGSQHSVAVNGKGEVLAWGRTDGHQIGQDLDDIPVESFYHDSNGEVIKRLLLKPTIIEEIAGAIQACASGDTSIAITKEGKAYSWGFSANYQTGQGTDEDVEEATVIDNTAVREEKLIWGGLGGQYGMLASVAKEITPKVNGVAH